MKDYKIFLTQKNETWQQALDRFARFCDADMKDYFLHKDYSYRFADNKAYLYRPEGKVSPECIAEFTEKYNVKVPPELVDLMCNHGAFCIGDGLLDVFDDIGADTILTLPQVLSLYGHSDFIDKIGPGMLKSLSGYYFFFGAGFTRSEEPSFLYFNKAGNFGKMLFAAGNEGLVLHKVLPSMFNGSIDKYTLDELISSMIDRVVINALTVRGYIE